VTVYLIVVYRRRRATLKSLSSEEIPLPPGKR
jgi:hypothetical protein